MKKKRKTLGNKSLHWINQTEGSKKLDVLKQYISEEEEVKNSGIPKISSLFHDDTQTIVRKKNKAKKTGRKSEEAMSVSEKEAIVDEIKEEFREETEKIETEKKKEEIKKEISHEKIKVKPSEALGRAKKKGAQVVDKISKAIGSEKLNIKKMVNSAVSTCSHPIGTISSIDRNINNSVKKIMRFDDKNLIDNNIMKPIKDIDVSVNRKIKKLLNGFSNNSK